MPDIGLKIGVDGEKSFNESLKNINSSLKLLGSEMKAVSSRFLDNNKSIEAYGEKNKVLSKQIETQKQKVEMLRGTLEKSKEMYGENDKRTKEWATKLNLAEAELNKLNNELKSNNTQMQSYKEISMQTATTIGKLDDEMGGLKSELDGVDNKYKKNKNSVEALNEKHRILSELMGKQSDKVETLKTALENSKNAYGKNSAETKRLEKALSDAESEMRSTERELGNVKNAMVGAGKESRTFGEMLKANLTSEAIVSGLRQVGESLKGLKNYITDGVKSAASFGKEISKLSRKTGISADTIQKFKAASKMTDVDVETFTKAYARSIKSMSSASATLGKAEAKAAEKVEKAHAKMAKAAAKSSKSAKGAKQAMVDGSKAMTEEILSFDDALEEQMDKTGGVTKAYQQLGINVVDSAGNLRDSKEVFWETIDSLKQMDNETERNALAMQIFGKSAMDLNPIIEQGSEGFNDLTQNMATFDDETIESLRGLEISMQKFGGVMENIKRSIGVAFAPVVKEIADAAADAGGKLRSLFMSIAKGDDQETINKKFEAFKESVVKLAETIQKQIPIFIEVGGKILGALWEGLVTAFAPILPQIAIWGGLVAAGFALWSALISAAIAAWPVTLALALAGLAVAFWPQIQEWLSNMWNGITDFFSNHWQDVLLWITNMPLAIIKTLNDTGMLEKIVVWLGDVWNGIVDFFGEHWQDVLLWITNMPLAIIKTLNDTGVLDSVKAWLGDIWQSIQNWFSDLWKNVTEWSSNVWNGFLKFMSELPTKIGYALGFAIGSILKFFKDTWDAFASFGKNAWNFVTVDVPRFITEMIDWFGKLPERIWNFLTDIISKIQSWGKDVGLQAIKTGESFFENVIDFFKNLPSNIAKWLRNTLDKVKNWVSDMIQKGKEMGSNMCENILKSIRELPGNVYNIGKNIIEGIWNGISDMGGWISNKIKGFCGGFLGGFKKALGINSPSKLFRDSIGKNLALGIQVGFDDEMRNVSKDMIARIPTNVDFEYDMKENTNHFENSNVSGVGRMDVMDFMVTAFQNALTGMAFKVDDEKLGELVINKVENVVFS